MASLNDIATGVVNNGFLTTGFFSYVVAGIYENAPKAFEFAKNYLENALIPEVLSFVSSNSSFILLGALSASLFTSFHFVSEGVTISKKKLLKLASDSKLDPEMVDNLRRKIPKKFENIFVFQERKLSNKEIAEYYDELFEICKLDRPHHCIPTLTNSLKEMNYHISFHDYSEIQIKERLIENGWNFNVINQAFMVIDMELCNEIGGAYFVLSSKDIALSMKYMKELAAKGYTQSRIKEYLLQHGLKESNINKVMSKIHKVQELHTKAKKNQEIKINRALRLNMVHPSVLLTTGNYNS